MQYAVTQLAKYVHSPTQAHMVMLKRCIRYLKGTAHLVLHLRPKGRLRITAFADSDWAGADDRRITSGVVLLLAGAVVLTFSRTQASRALSSCEAELYGMGSTSAEAMHLAAFLTEQVWCDEPPLVFSDSSSALTLTGRRGQGRLKHVEVRLLAIQDWREQKRITAAKVGTEENIADVLTKYVSRSILETLLPLLGLGEP